MKSISSMTRFISLAVIFFAAAILRATEPAVPPALTGYWDGDARIIVSWCRQPNLHVAVDIHRDGSVTGKVGDATIVKGRLEQNRGWIGRKLSLATDHIIKAELSGPVVAAESVTRERVSIPLDLVGDALVGGVHTSGAKFGGKNKMILSAASLKLKRPE
jgi:hypothetical protein